MAIRISEGQFANLPSFIQRQIVRATKRTLIEAARRANDSAKKTAEQFRWSGEYKRGFTLEEGRDSDEIVVRVYNDAPHAEAIEIGQAPYQVSSVEFHRIVQWAKTKLGLDENRARRMAISVSMRIAEKGKYALGLRYGKANYVLKFAVMATANAIPARWKANMKKALEKTKVTG